MPRIRKAATAAENAQKAQWRAGIYIRLSRDDGNNESYSITNQRQRLVTYFEALQVEESLELFDIYVDDGFTGTDSNRDDFQRMLQDIHKKFINCVIVKDLSRLSRNDWECKMYLQQLFVQKDVRFISLELPKLDSFLRPDEVYDLGVTMQSTYNENHCRETSIKVRGTFDTKRKAGEFIGAFAPYGYLKSPENRHILIVDPNSAPIVRDIFQWFALEGLSKTGIVKKLTALGVPSPMMYKRQNGQNYQNPASVGEPFWSTRTISAILQNRMYLGHMVQGKQRVKSYKIHTRINLSAEHWIVKEHTHEALVDLELFDKAQNLLLRDTKVSPDSVKLYPFSGFLRCADCGKAMHRRTAKNHVYYACRTHVDTRQCSRHSIRHDRLEQLVLGAIQQQISFIENLSELLDDIDRAPIQQREQQRLEAAFRQKKQALEKTSAIKTELYTDWKSGDISREDFIRMKRTFDQKEQQQREELAELETERRCQADKINKENPYFSAFLRNRNLTELNRGIVAELIHGIRVHEGGNIDIEFNFAEQRRKVSDIWEQSPPPEA